MSELEIIKTAKRSSDQHELLKLSKHNSPMVRRAVAKNSFTPVSALENLSYDPVMNVSFMAVNNRNNTSVDREFYELHPCVVCTQDELLMNCMGCDILKSYKS